MKRFIAILASVGLIFCVFAPVFSASAISLGGIGETAFFPEPPDVNGVSYLILDDGNGDSNGYSGFIFTIVFPLVSKEQCDNGELTAEWHLLQDSVELWVNAPTLAGIPFYVYLHRLNGQELNVYTFTIPAVNNSPFTYTFTLSGALVNYVYYWAKGFIPAYQTGSAIYHPAMIYFLPDYTYSTTLKNIYDKLNTLISMQNQSNYLLDQYINLFEAFYRRNHEDLNNISSQLNDIYELLGGGQTTESMPDNSEAESNIDNYINEESSYMSNFEDGINDFEELASDAQQQINGISNGFGAVKQIFETFVIGMPATYIVILFSLIFGIVVLILGKRMG